MISIGIDVGKNGGIVALDSNGEIALKSRIPKIGTKVDYRAIHNLLSQYANVSCIVAIEDVHSIHGVGAKANFEFGHIKGFKIGVLVSLKMRYDLVQPKVWQKAVWAIPDIVYKPSKPNEKTKKIDTKKTSLLAAKRLFPYEDFIPTAKSKNPHDGLVDAALIAYYLFTKTKNI